MSIADKIFIENCREIIDKGVWDTDFDVSPRWLDGTPAHTVKKFCIVNRYDLTKEFPILTLRRTAFKSAIDEILWIWQKKSNNIKDLNSHIWDQWADEEGSIGKAYGYQFAKKYPEPIDYFIFGHRHLMIDLMLKNKNRIIILGDWIEHFSYASFDGENLILDQYYYDGERLIKKKKKDIDEPDL